MKIRNLPFKELNETEQKIVLSFYKECVEDEHLCKNQSPCNKGVNEFWEVHREADTQNGEYGGWIE